MDQSVQLALLITLGDATQCRIHRCTQPKSDVRDESEDQETHLFLLIAHFVGVSSRSCGHPFFQEPMGMVTLGVPDTQGARHWLAM
eukprot:5788625-Amphidinium_carterae.1